MLKVDAEHQKGLLITPKVSVCGVKPCPNPGSIRHHWWSSGQDLCIRYRGSLVARVRTLVGAEVGATLIVLQSGDPDVIFTHHTRCKVYCTTHCTALYDLLYCTPLLPAVCFSLLSSTLLLSISLTHQHVNTPLLSNLDAWGELCGVKPCPAPGRIRYYWWSSGQDLCFRCRGSPAYQRTDDAWPK